MTPGLVNGWGIKMVDDKVKKVNETLNILAKKMHSLMLSVLALTL